VIFKSRSEHPAGMRYVAQGMSCLETLFVLRVSWVTGATERKNMLLHLQFRVND